MRTLGTIFPLIVFERMIWPTAFYWGIIFLLACIIVYLLYQNKVSKVEELERLRKQIAQDFHDELGSKLSIISMYSELTKSQLADKIPTASKYLDKIINTSNSLYGSMKDLLWALDPGQDTFGDLVVKIKDFGEELFGDSDIEFHFLEINSSIQRILLPMDYKRHILLILKESMNNAIKHADCSYVKLDIQPNGQYLKINFSDNGKGFQTEDKYSGDGIKNMKNRAHKINAKLFIDSTKKGTSLELQIPFPKNDRNMI